MHGAAWSRAGGEQMAFRVLCLVWGLWSLLAFAGGLAFAPLTGLAGLLLAYGVYSERSFTPRLYMLPLLLLLLWAAASALWSPRPFEFVDINLSEADFNVRSEVLRVGLGLLATAIIIAAASRLRLGQARAVLWVAAAAMAAQIVLVALTSFFEDEALDLFAPLMSARGEGVQNITRNSLIALTALPVFVALFPRSRAGWAAGIVGAVLLFAALAIRGVMAGFLAIAAAGVACAIVRLFPRSGFRVLAGLLAATVWAMPLVAIPAVGVIREADAETSADWRMLIWTRVVTIIADHPIAGGGLGVLRTVDESIEQGAFAGERLIASHPHNMPLQVWAEGGAIGALLLSALILLAGRRMPSPNSLGRLKYSVAAFVAIVSIVCFVSFDLWNEWWWAVVGHLAALLVLRDRARPGAHEPT
jgi:O-antigen ligase